MDVRTHADDAAALLDALDAAPAVVIGRSQGGEIALDLALRYPDRVRALALLEGGGLALGEAARRWLAALDEQVFAAAAAGMETVAPAMLGSVLGEGGWEALPEPVRRVFSENAPAIVAEHRGGLGDVTLEQLGAIAQPALVVAAEDSPPELAEVSEILASALPSGRLVHVSGGHLIDPAHAAVLAFVDEVLAG
jgi:pimeloyl-ACP methyl ester carboxylesterase